MELKLCSVVGIIFLYIMYCFFDAYKIVKKKNEVISYIKTLSGVHNKNISNLQIEITFWVFLVEDVIKNTLNLLLFAIILILLIMR